MSSFLDTLKYQFKAGGMYLKLLYVNIGVFVILWFLEVLGELTMTPQLFGQAYLNLGVITNLQEFIYKPWTVLTYMFVHQEFFHLFSNMLMLFFLGKMLETYLGPKKVLSIYILGGLSGVLLHLVAANTFPLLIAQGPAFIIGASGAVFALSVALITFNPSIEVRLFGVIPMKLIWLVGAYFFLELFKVSNVGDHVAHFTHVGGGIFGFVAMARYKKGQDITKWFDSLIAWFLGLFSRKPKMKVKYSKFRDKPQKAKPPRDDYEYNASKAEQQERLDKILDKIKYKGYEGLTKEEKDFLAKF